MSSGTSGNGGNGGNDPILAELRLIRAEAQQTNARLEALEEATLAGFRTVGERLDHVETATVAGFRAMGDRIDALEAATRAGFETVGKELSGIRTIAVERHLELDQRLRKVETRLDGLESNGPRRRRH